MRYYVFMLLVLSLLFTGCSSKQAVYIKELTLPYDSSEAAKFAQPGDNTVKGSALMRTQGGSVYTCAANNVALIPVTAYSTERMKIIYGTTNNGYRQYDEGKVQFNQDSQEYYRTERHAFCNKDGEFVFKNLPDGEYFVVSEITWVYGYNWYTPVYTGGSLMTRVSVSSGETKEIVLSY